MYIEILSIKFMSQQAQLLPLLSLSASQNLFTVPNLQ